MSTGLLIATCGKARVGKNTFGTILSEIVWAADGRRLRSMAFAHALKAELDSFLIRTYDISAFTCNAADKAIIRPHLVERGAGARKEDPDHWVKILDPQVREFLIAGDVVHIEDCRYANEVRWVQSLGGKVVYLSRLLEDGSEVPAANEEEAREDPGARALSDIHLTWPTLPLDMLRPFVQDVWMQLTAPVSTP